jgi:hypothetical protein
MFWIRNAISILSSYFFPPCLFDCLLLTVFFICSLGSIFLYLLLLNPSLIPQFPTPYIHSFTKKFSVFTTAYLHLFVLRNVPDLSTDLIWQNTWCTPNRLVERESYILVYARFSVLIPSGTPPILSEFFVTFLSPFKRMAVEYAN